MKQLYQALVAKIGFRVGYYVAIDKVYTIQDNMPRWREKKELPTSLTFDFLRYLKNMIFAFFFNNIQVV